MKIPRNQKEERSKFKRLTIDSSTIEAVDFYSSKEQELILEFKAKDSIAGPLYRFEGITKEMFDAFLASESKGKFFHANIRNKFPAVKIRNKIVEETKDAADIKRNSTTI